MKQNYKKKQTLIIIFSYFPWNILDSWKSNIFVNSCVRLALVDFWSQFSTSHAIFNHRAYVEWVDRIISYKFSSFSIRDVTFRSTFPMPHTLKPNTCNSCFETNLTKLGFGNGGHCFVAITNLFHLHWALTWVRLATF
jgi:hypothetical protein